MVKVAIIAKNGRTYGFFVPGRDDFLSTLDNFLKKNTLDTSLLKRVSVFCIPKESTGCRVAKASIAALRSAGSKQNHIEKLKK
ncbi:hypothetical protein HY250_01655 [Candidatus Azambacteria bacterium]|nr:hypothetical protein [Candidatus Azambacteria bacterium]MBI3685086.1 hypothetical protein [Candidatus Azambacteria bacterium]